MWIEYLVVLLFGAAGVGARLAVYGIASFLVGDTLPWGTFFANVSGCFAIGLFAGLTGPDAPFLLSPLIRQAVMVGFLGGYTTYSSFSLNTINLLADGQTAYALANIFATLLLCLVGTWAGLILANALSPR